MYLLPDDKRDGSLQLLMLDCVLGAGCPGLVFIGRAEITVILSDLASGNSFLTIRTTEKTTEQGKFLFPGSRPGITL